MLETTPISQSVFYQVVGSLKEQLQDPWIKRQFSDLIGHDLNHLTQGNPHLAILDIAGVDCRSITELISRFKKGGAGFTDLKENLPLLFEKIISQSSDAVNQDDLQQSLDYIKGLIKFIPPIIDSASFLYSFLQDQQPPIKLLESLASHRVPVSTLTYLGCQVETDNHQEIELDGIDAVIVFNLVLNATNAHLINWQGINTDGEQKVVVSFDQKGRINITNLSQRSLGDNRQKLEEYKIIYGSGFGLTIAGLYAAFSEKKFVIREEKLNSPNGTPYYRISITLQPEEENQNNN